VAVNRQEDTVRRLDPAKLHVEWAPGSTPAGPLLRPALLAGPLLRPALLAGPLLPRTYTLTHSDSTGDLYLTVGPAYDKDQTSGWYTRFMRDEVLAEWLQGDNGLELHVHCHISGGVIAGSPGWRDAIFRRELPLVLEAFRFGDQQLVTANPELDNLPIWVHFHSSSARYDRVETWGTWADYR
jgi:hypothetical protein